MIENTPIKDTNGKRMFKRLLRLIFVDKRELFAMKLSLKEFNLVFFPADQSAWHILNQPRQQDFWRNLRYILYSMVKESTFLKGNFCIYKVFYILTSMWKTSKCAFKKVWVKGRMSLQNDIIMRNLIYGKFGKEINSMPASLPRVIWRQFAGATALPVRFLALLKQG